MADQIGYITFENVSLSNGTATGSFSNTTVEIDYTTNTVVGVINGPLTFTVDGKTTTFSPLHMTAHTPGGSYGIYAGTIQDPGLRLEWTGAAPTAFSGAVAIVPGSTGNIFDTFVTNSIQPVICFAAGTLILTPAGEVPVETLKPGDLVLTASGARRPVKWIGHADVDFRRTPKGSPGLPIRIAADAFGPSRPSQDLYLSAGHSVCVDLVGEVLIPVGHLVNGGTIAEIDADTISYWHVELDSHDILIANNLPAESYLAVGNRGAFEELRGLLPAMVEGQDRTHADFCRPVITEGPTLDFVRQRLAARAEEIGWKPQRDADLRLIVDGRIVRPLAEDGSAAFLFRADAKDVRLISNAFVPTALGSTDRRTLGVMLAGLVLSGSGGEPRQISLDDDRLVEGAHHLEDHGGKPRRWTNGELVLDARLWAGLSGQVALHVLFDHATLRGWAAPPARAKAFDAVDRPKLYAVG